MAELSLELSEREERFGEIAFAFLRAKEEGRCPDREEWLARYPEFALELDGFLADQDEVDRLAAPLRAIKRMVPAEAALTEIPEKTIGDRPGRPAEAEAESFADYELLEEIGRGGMGVVYKARQKSLNRLVALKVLRAGDLGGERELERFRNEAEMVALLDHPGIVPVHEVGSQNGRHYFSMKLIEGGNLAGQLARFTAQPRLAATLLAGVARAIHHAHQRGILHRDLKPSNILLDQDGRPHVTDFGLAKRVETDSSLTQSGTLVGTPSYMAPEQAIGQKGAVTTTTDVYGLGAILYVLLTGQPPFRAGTVAETVMQVKDRDPEPPARVSRRVDRDLETICLKCLEKEPVKRYATAEALADDLERWLRREPIQARPVRWLERCRRWCVRNPLLAALWAVLASLVVVVMAGLIVSIHLIRGQRDEAQRQEGLARERALSLRRLLYAADVRLAHDAWKKGELTPVWEILAPYEPGPEEDDLRTFGWYYLWRLSHNQPRATVLAGHRGDVYHVAYARDGKALATSGKDGTVRLWNAATGATQRVIRVSADEVNWVEFSPDGKTLATAGDDKEVKLWDRATGREKGRLPRLGSPVVSVVFAPDGRTLATGQFDGTVCLWDLRTKHLVKQLDFPNGNRLEALAFAPDGKTLATISSGNPYSLCTACKLTEPWLRWSHAFFGSYRCVAFSGDSKLLACAGYRGDVDLLDPATGQALGKCSNHLQGILSVAFSPDTQTLASGSLDGTVCIWNRRVGKLLNLVQAEQQRVWCVAYSPDGNTLATTGGDGTLKLWALRDNLSQRTILFPHPVNAIRNDPAWTRVTISGDGRTAAALGRTNCFWNLETGKQLQHLCRIGRLTDLSFSQDGRTLLTLKGATTVQLWEAATGRLLRTFRGPFKKIRQVVLGPDGRTALTNDDRIRIWNAATGEQIGCLSPDHAGESAVLSPDGRTLATFQENGSVSLWDLATRSVRRTLAGHRVSILAAAFSANGKTLVTGDRHGRLKLWDVTRGTERPRLTGHGGPVYSGAFAPDGKSLATGSSDGTVKLWDVNSGQELMTLEGHTGGVGQLIFAPDGHTLLSVCSLGKDRSIEVVAWQGARDVAPSGRK